VHKVRNQEIMSKFGDNLRRIRNEKGLTQEDLAYDSGISLSQIARIETGKLNTSICTVVALAEALKIDPSELMKFPSEKKKKSK
jgi:transcriptional regulator with XRE-family HTH domain